MLKSCHKNGGGSPLNPPLKGTAPPTAGLGTRRGCHPPRQGFGSPPGPPPVGDRGESPCHPPVWGVPMSPSPRSGVSPPSLEHKCHLLAEGDGDRGPRRPGEAGDREPWCPGGGDKGPRHQGKQQGTQCPAGAGDKGPPRNGGDTRPQCPRAASDRGPRDPGQGDRGRWCPGGRQGILGGNRGSWGVTGILGSGADSEGGQ